MTRNILGLLVMGLASVQAMAAPKTYALKCRPGTQTAVNISVKGELRFGFTRSNKAAGAKGENLKPGECAWVDRAVGPNEPAYVVAALSPDFKVGAVVPHASNKSFGGYAYAETQAWVYNFLTKDTILTIYAYNNNGTEMRVPNP